MKRVLEAIPVMCFVCIFSAIALSITGYPEIGLVLMLSSFFTPFVLCLIDKYKGTHWSCDSFGWHNGNGQSVSTPSGFDGCSLHATCSKCGKEVMQDGQGNWF
jgi:hypothetical protein